jgi:hypothetical protein
MTAAQPERFGAAGKAHFVSGGAGWARFLAWLSGCATRAVMPYGILMLAIAGLTPAVIAAGGQYDRTAHSHTHSHTSAHVALSNSARPATVAGSNIRRLSRIDSNPDVKVVLHRICG